MEIKKFYKKLYTEIFEAIYELIKDPEHESGLYNLPQKIKDLVYLSKLEYELLLDDEEIDHQKFIDEYKGLIGLKVEDNKIVDDEN